MCQCIATPLPFNLPAHPNHYICHHHNHKLRRSSSSSPFLFFHSPSPFPSATQTDSHPSLSCLGPSVPRRPPSLSLRTISSKLKETSSEATPRVKNSPQHCSPGATALLRRFLFLVAPPANRPKTDRPTRIPMSSSYFSSSSAPPTLHV